MSRDDANNVIAMS